MTGLKIHIRTYKSHNETSGHYSKKKLFFLSLKIPEMIQWSLEVLRFVADFDKFSFPLRAEFTHEVLEKADAWC